MSNFDFSTLKKEKKQKIIPVIKEKLDEKESLEQTKPRKENKYAKLLEEKDKIIEELKLKAKIVSNDNPKGKFYRDLAKKFELGLDYNRDELRFLVRYLQIECLPYGIKVFMNENSKKLLKDTLKVLEELKTRNLYDKIF